MRVQPQTTIIIPALNEAEAIGGVVRDLLACPDLQAVGIRDVLVVDNGSNDGTADVARSAGARVVREPARGYGRACRAGVVAASDAEIIIQMDGDGSDRPADVRRVWDLVQSGAADLALGSRTRGRRERGALTLPQLAGNAVGAAILRRGYGVRVTDLPPLRAIRRADLLRLDLREMTYGWSAEMLAKAGRAGLRVAEVPVDYRRRAAGRSKVAGTVGGTLKAAARIMSTLLRSASYRPAPRRALLVVCRAPVAGRTKTRLGRAIGFDTAADLYAAFLRDLGQRLHSAARRDGYDLWWYLDAADTDALAGIVPPGDRTLLQPAGAEFAARLWHGYQALRARGYAQIAVVGSDSPHLPAARVAAAFAALDYAPASFGPALDGGYYLLAQRGEPVDCFTGVPMSTVATGAATLARLRALQGRGRDTEGHEFSQQARWTAGHGLRGSRLSTQAMQIYPWPSASVRDHPCPVQMVEKRILVAEKRILALKGQGTDVAMLPPALDVDEADDLAALAALLRAAPSDEADPAPATLAALATLAAGAGAR